MTTLIRRSLLLASASALLVSATAYNKSNADCTRGAQGGKNATP